MSPSPSHRHSSSTVIIVMIPILSSRSIMILTISSGWWYTYPSEKYEFASWDDYSQYIRNIQPPTRYHVHPWDFSLICHPHPHDPIIRSSRRSSWRTPDSCAKQKRFGHIQGAGHPKWCLLHCKPLCILVRYIMLYPTQSVVNQIWLVVSTPLKNILY